ncbi:MAG: hypothetical protein ACI865_002338 [Flavobacteriaceae bacterium]|jgi:hypothetical protein
METENWIDVFHSDVLNKSLRDEGIAKISLADFDPKRYLSFLETTVDGYPKEFESAFYGSVSIADMDVKRKVHAGIYEMLSPSIESLLVNHRMLTYFFLVKGIGENSILKLHQDWSIIDERKHRAYNLWIPLCDSTRKNGTLYAAKGTHRMPLNIRGAAIPPKYADHFKSAERYMEAFEIKEGEGLIFDSRLLHYSPTNTTDKSRSTIINNIIPIGAETMCFHGTEKDGHLTVNRYDVPDDLFIHYDHFNEQKDNPNPAGKLVEKIDYARTEPVELADFMSQLKATSAKKKRWFF